MDRGKDFDEELSKPKNLVSSASPPTIEDDNTITTPTNTTTTTTTTIITTCATDDDDASNESSDTSDTWTLLNDKEKCSFLADNLENANEQRLEIVKDSDNTEISRSEDEIKIVQDSQNSSEDFSDGISIISESESMGRISPHTYFRDNLHDLNMRLSFSEHMDNTILSQMREETENNIEPLLLKTDQESTLEPKLRQRHAVSTENASAAEAILKAFADEHALRNIENTSTNNRGVVSALDRFFYAVVCVFVVIFIIHLDKPIWQPISQSPSIVELEQKFNDMELKNNLMRAEIDLLSKQVKYLSSINDPQKAKSSKYNDYKQGKTFKAWPGNGDNLKPVDITKQDMKTPYICPPSDYVQIAGSCIEKKFITEDVIGQILRHIKQPSEIFETIEQVAEEFHNVKDAEKVHEIPKHNKYDKAEMKYEANKREYKHKHNAKDEYKKHSKEDHSKERFNKKHFDDSGENSEEKQSKENYNNEKHKNADNWRYNLARGRAMKREENKRSLGYGRN